MRRSPRRAGVASPQRAKYYFDLLLARGAVGIEHTSAGRVFIVDGRRTAPPLRHCGRRPMSDAASGTPHSAPETVIARRYAGRRYDDAPAAVADRGWPPFPHQLGFPAGLGRRGGSTAALCAEEAGR
jgi:hypothetical protein